jgi:ABC-type sugar transport system ATPase subunit
MAEIVVDHVTKEFAGGVQAIERRLADRADGEFIVLVGPRGAASRPCCG